MTKTQAENPVEVEDMVKLKPILGLRPGIYLAVLYFLVILIVFFFVLWYPGLKNPGSLVEFKSEPDGAALRVDGVYRGAAQRKFKNSFRRAAQNDIFISRGMHDLEVILPGFSPEYIKVEIPGRVFASAFFPRRFPLQVTLRSPDPVAAFASAAADYAAWTFGGEPTASWQVPLSLSEAAYRLGPALAGEYEVSELRASSRFALTRGDETAELLRAASRFAVTRASLRDLVRAKFLVDSGGLPPSPAGIVQSAADIISFLSENPESAAWLASLLPPESAALASASAWGKSAAQTGTAAGASPVSGDLPAAFQLAGLSFTRSGGVLICGEQTPAAVFAQFLEAAPQWKAEKREELITAGLASSAYLADGVSPDGDSVIRSVSWFAAEAFCQWLSTRLPASMADYEVRLPAEAEWEAAAFRGAPFREWCADPYAPLPFIKASNEAAAAIGSPERPVRGGVSPNAGVSSKTETRASLPPAFCSPFVSFRPVIARKAR